MASQSLKVRTFQHRDRDGCLEIFDSNVPRFFRPHERPEFEAFLRALPGPYLVLMDGSGSTVACGGYAITEDSGVADLCWGMVRQDEHGNGYGRALAEARIAQLRADSRVQAIALQTSHHTATFYERLGFRTTRTVADGYGPGLHRHDLIMEVGR